MVHTVRDWVALESPTAGHAGHGSHPCRGLYQHPRDQHLTAAFIATHYKGPLGLGRAITVPSPLVIQSSADKGVFPSDARAIHDPLGAEDKSLGFPPGEHYFEDGGRDDGADLIESWTEDHGG